VLAGILDWMLATPIDKVLYKYRRHDARRLSEIYEANTAYDILFIGSSRTHRSIYPRIIDSICGINSYNAGTESGAIHDFKLTLEGYLVHHPAPRVVVLTLDLSSFMKPYGVHFYPQYYPYLDNEVVSATLTKYGYGAQMVRYFPFLMITDFDDFSKESAIQMLRGRDTSDIPAGDFEYKGFISNTENYIKKAELEPVKKYMAITPESVASLNDIVSECRKRNIKLIFTYAPEYDFNLQKRRTNTDSVFALITATAARNGIPYLRDDSLPLCHNPALFANNGHLNKPGAMIYSAVLADELNRVMARPKDPAP
jgi:hypothetical protein